MRRFCTSWLVVATAIWLGFTSVTAPANAEPTVEEIAPPLPVIVPVVNGWQPKFPFPYDQTRNEVTGADITAEGEMCQWYTAQYDSLIAQIERFDDSLSRANGDYGVAGNQQIADAVLANLDQSLAYLTPRAQALTMSQNYLGDQYFPMYQGETFYWLWQQLSNVSAGIHGHQPAWFVGPSLQRAKRWGSRIHRSGVCD